MKIGKNYSPINNKDLRLRAFQALCDSRALRYSGKDLHLHEAVDFLQQWADEDGLIEEIGQDAVQWEMTKAFLPYKGE